MLNTSCKIVPFGSSSIVGSPYPFKRAWRSESGLTHPNDTTVLDIINFEADELGNKIIREQALSVNLDLSRYNWKDTVWVTNTKEAANRYYGKAVELNLPKDNIVIADDDEYGYLVLFIKRVEPTSKNFATRIGDTRMTSAELTRFSREDTIADIKNDGRWWYFNRIYTPPQYRNKGYGTQVLKQVIAWADKEGQNIYLDRNAYGAETCGLNDAQLKVWYSKYGFVPIPSKRSEYKKSMMRRYYNARTVNNR